ncbi:MAG: DNA-3-methyladenine glycosylase [Flavobacteriales bacterium]
MLLKRSFYLQEDVVRLSRELLGKVIITGEGRDRTVGIITETEAYAGEGDRASHAYRGRRTPRNEVMFGKGGVAYVYRCYGIHNLFNVVTNVQGVPHAILIRAVEPLEGEAVMRSRRGAPGKHWRSGTLSGGPGTLTTALGIELSHNSVDLTTGIIRIEDAGFTIPHKAILIGPRIGVEYAKEDALLPYRFRVTKDHSFAP